jgi:hypothetical protein
MKRSSLGLTPRRREYETRRKKGFFFEKKKQKTFAYGAPQPGHKVAPAEHEQIKVFWFFFSKKNNLSFSLKSENAPPASPP